MDLQSQKGKTARPGFGVHQPLARQLDRGLRANTYPDLRTDEHSSAIFDAGGCDGIAHPGHGAGRDAEDHADIDNYNASAPK